MSFSQNLRKELCTRKEKYQERLIAELSGFLTVNGRWRDDSLEIRAENDELEEKVRLLISAVFNYSSESLVLSEEIKHHRKLILNDKAKIYEILLKSGLKNYGRFFISDGRNEKTSEIGQSYLRGNFLAGGSVGTPEKSYQLELLERTEIEAYHVLKMMNVQGVPAKLIIRKNDRYVIYVKDGNAISNLIGMMGAPNSMMEFENARIVKDMRNSINRENNCDTANITKTANAASQQITDIHLIESKLGLHSLSESLRDVAKMRLEYPYLSMKELGEQMIPVLGKSGVRHRLNRISDIAEGLRKGE